MEAAAPEIRLLPTMPVGNRTRIRVWVATILLWPASVPLPSQRPSTQPAAWRYRQAPHGGTPVTAEVAILNRSAVALAADSAVTLGLTDPKVYNTANKLFALSVTEPVAIMIYGAASLGPIPWETVIKEYRRELGTTQFDTVDEYASHFVRHLASLAKYVTKGEQRYFVHLRSCWELDKLRRVIVRSSHRANTHRTSNNGTYHETLTLDCIEARIAELKELGYVDMVTAPLMGQWMRAELGDWNSFIDEHWDGPQLTTQARQRLRVLVRTSLRVAIEWPESSGVVITGFGKAQIFPALSHYVVDGVVATRVRTRHVGSIRIDDQHTALIIPFAQRDMVTTFMNGIDPNYLEAIDEFVDETLTMLSQNFGDLIQDLIPTASSEDIVEIMSQARAAIVENFRDRLNTMLEEENSQPIMSIVESLPKDELAEMAEALVNLTSFKRRVTPEAETVGGPIDVAVISKGDGLIWIERKTLFLTRIEFSILQQRCQFPQLCSI